MCKTVCVKGSPLEQGVKQGELLREVIEENIRQVKDKIKKDHVDQGRYRSYVKRNAEFMEKNHGDLWAEMKGISDGSGIPFEDILLLNIPAYFMTGYLQQECSMIMARGKATADGCTYVVKNRDMSTYIHQVAVERHYENGLKILEVNGAGTVTYPASGMNSHGLGVATTGFWSAKARPELEQMDSTHIFVNVHILLECCQTASEALNLLKKMPRMNGLNVILVDRTDAYLVEMTKDQMYVQQDRGEGLFYRTNHYLSKPLKPLNPDMEEYSSTFVRYERIKQLLQDCYGRIRFQDLLRIMSDHNHGTDAICRHPRPGAPSWTMSTSLFVLEDKEAYTILDNPCKSIQYSCLQ